ncbi:MAG TPA: ABC transporter ATP-binding protein [Polyangiaceae bacterium]|nr:ABC transporter ATP-binding protein [Polyangiaceae bacterium]
MRPYKAPAVLALVLLAILVAFDLSIPRLVQRIIDQGIGGGNRSLVIHASLLMLGVSALSTVFAIGNNVASVKVGEGVARDLRRALFLKIQSFSYGNLDRMRTGELLVRLTSDVAAIKGLVQVSLRIGTRAPLMMVGSLILMVNTSPHLALVLLPLLLVTSLLIGFFVLRTEPLFHQVQVELDALNGVLQENIAGARVVKALVRSGRELERFDAANDSLTRRSVTVTKFSATMMPLLTLCVNIGTVVVIWAGGLEGIQGQLTLGQIVAFANYLLSTMTPLVMMTLLASMWAAGFASLRRVERVLATQPEVVDAKDAGTLATTQSAEVRFDDVAFAYRLETDTATNRVLQDVNIEARAGQMIAILGATGVGKSTLVNLIPRFYDVTTGAVRVQTRDVRELQQASLLDQIAIAPQEALLFSGSVRDNIAYGRPTASDEEVEAAAKLAQAHEFITQLSEGYRARVAPRGANFSGGQRQRLCIARALLLGAPILILDDSTSAVDIETEGKIQDALRARQNAGTLFVVAQRISSVLRADRIVVLESGRVVATGTHSELLNTSAAYREIYDSQLGAGGSE